MVDNGFGNNENPWDNDPSKAQEDGPTAPQIPMPPMPMEAAIPVPPPPPSSPPGVGTYYGNQVGYGVSGPSNDGMAIASMVVGILGLVSFCFWFISIILDIIAIVLAGVSMARISKSNGYLGGKGFAITGLVCGILGIIATVLFWVSVLTIGNNGWY